MGAVKGSHEPRGHLRRGFDDVMEPEVAGGGRDVARGVDGGVVELRPFHILPRDEDVWHLFARHFGPQHVRPVPHRRQHGMQGVEGPPHDAELVHANVTLGHVGVYLDVEAQPHEMPSQEDDRVLAVLGPCAILQHEAGAPDPLAEPLEVAGAAEDCNRLAPEADAVLLGHGRGVLLPEACELQPHGKVEVRRRTVPHRGSVRPARRAPLQEVLVCELLEQ